MSCIVGVLEKNGNIIIGADSAGCCGKHITVRKDSKVFRNGDFLIGCAGSFRYMQLLQYIFKPDKVGRNKDVFEYMIRTFIPKLKECFRDNGWTINNNGQEDGDCEFLVGYKGRLFQIWPDFQIDELIYGYHAAGSGMYYAYGSLHSTTDKPAKQRVLMALEAAEAFSAEVKRPFQLMELPYMEDDN